MSFNYKTPNGTIFIERNVVCFKPKEGDKNEIKIQSNISASILIGDFPMYVVVGCVDGNVISIEFPSCSQTVITRNQLAKIKSISALPDTHRYLTLTVDDQGSVLIYDHLYNKKVIYSPPLPSQIISVEYFYPLCVMLFSYADGRSFVWSLDTGSLLSTLQYSVPQDRIKSTIVYQTI
ncbi:hypothetical protein EDI_059540 [Entamoeba dispar SAW760]|uniref:Uncharacterized protein n=1 Tax=Entamoeba dispar (strain ATCC PRA-260 / SAW760) TaxID=370354 RepID=B0EFW9_ENTDS|nr:uncharacterized protein EDI_059540 [Entamoeba dispar SAW760]EDR26575.1 hypothetical protein EDI_059540 [Entamoeba dispar SAW760]|eukprot:EDR26575.1 hypothetical protein EDI_059540 [Entamoeba dispar SAW760]